MQRIRTFLSTESKKLAALPPKARPQYIWMYYKIPIIALAFAVFFVSYMHGQMSAQLAESHFAACFGNTTAQLDGESEFARDYAQYAGYDLSEKSLAFFDECYCHPSERSSMNNAYFNLLVTYLDSGTIDVLVMDEIDVAAVGASGRLIDLRDERTRAIYEKYADRLVWCIPNEQSDYSDEPVPVAINLAGSRLVGEGKPYEEAALGINALAPHIGQVETFLAYLFEEEQP